MGVTEQDMRGLPIRVRGLVKTFGTVRAVDAVDLDVRPGRVTGLLGPNGSGKTTLMRLLVGLARPDAGTATIGGQPYGSIPFPQRVVGTSLEAAFHPGRTARAHLRTVAPAVGARDDRIAAVLEQVGLSEAADRAAGGFSLGMRQRLALATTLLGDPDVLVLDEPANGLDPHGIAWLRDLLRHLAREGRTVLVSSHHLTEVQASVDDVVVLSRGKLVHASSLEAMVAMVRRHVLVQGPDVAALRTALREGGWQAVADGAGLRVTADSAAEIGHCLHRAGVEIHALQQVGADLEQTFLQIVTESMPGHVRPLDDPLDALRGPHALHEEVRR